MPVAITPFQRRQERQEAPKESAIDSLLKGLQIAGSAMGLYTNLQQAQAYKQQQETGKFELGQKQEAAAASKEAQARATRNEYTEPEFEQKLSEGKLMLVAPPAKGSPEEQTTLQKFVVGASGERRPVFLQQMKPVVTEAKSKVIADTAAAKAEGKKTAAAAAATVRAGKEQAKAAERSAKSIADLRKEYLRNPLTTATENVAASWERIQGGFSNPSAAGDLNLLSGYMRMVDPGSAVKEGEFANAQNAAGVPEQVRATYNRALKGTRLTDETRKDFYNQGRSLVSGQLKRQESLDNEYRRIIKSNNWDENQMIFVQKPSGFEKGPVKKGMRAADLESL